MAQIEIHELKTICQEMAELGAAQYVKQTKPSKDLVSQREAYRTFSESRVKRWVISGQITCFRSGETSRSKKLYSMADLLSVEKSERINSIIQQ